MPERKTAGGEWFDTYNTISASCDEQILESALALCPYYNNLLSKTIPGSDIWRINHAEGRATKVSQETMQILKLSERMNRDSNGAFNIALEPLTALWKTAAREKRPPSGADIRRALENTDCTQIRLGIEDVTVPPGMRIDLGGVAKGYIAQKTADFLRERSVSSALLNFGGNVVTVGRREDGRPWSVGLQSPAAAAGQGYWAVVRVADGTVVTSGVYERGFDLNGIRYHHILDPRTGLPVQNGLLAVSAVTSGSSSVADAITTAMFVLGPEAGMALAEKWRVQAVFLKDDGQVTYSKNLDISFV